MATKKKANDENEEIIEEVTVENPLQKELDELNEKYLRLLAEYDNFRKRSSKEKLSMYTGAKEEILKELLPIIDNFERANTMFETNADEYKKGMDMTYGQLTATFTKLGVESFGEINEKFDPNLHNAVMHEDNSEFGENEICDVLQKGYKIGEKIIRPAMVRVAN